MKIEISDADSCFAGWYIFFCDSFPSLVIENAWQLHFTTRLIFGRYQRLTSSNHMLLFSPCHYGPLLSKPPKSIRNHLLLWKSEHWTRNRKKVVSRLIFTQKMLQNSKFNKQYQHLQVNFPFRNFVYFQMWNTVNWLFNALILFYAQSILINAQFLIFSINVFCKY